jgi:hypothetical protein
MCHITTWEEDYKGNNTSPSLQSPLVNSWSPSCTSHDTGERTSQETCANRTKQRSCYWCCAHHSLFLNSCCQIQVDQWQVAVLYVTHDAKRINSSHAQADSAKQGWPTTRAPATRYSRKMSVRILKYSHGAEHVSFLNCKALAMFLCRLFSQMEWQHKTQNSVRVDSLGIPTVYTNISKENIQARKQVFEPSLEPGESWIRSESYN